MYQGKVTQVQHRFSTQEHRPDGLMFETDSTHTAHTAVQVTLASTVFADLQSTSVNHFNTVHPSNGTVFSYINTT